MISILRLGHRIHRDIRVTTHLALTARAFLADTFYYTGQSDSSFENSIEKINQKWGSLFRVRYIPDYKNFLKEIKALKIHLTMYGELLPNKIEEIRNCKNDILIMVGGQKVPPDIYQIADLNISVTTQPISEISSVAIFLNEFFKGKPLTHEFKNSKNKVIPQQKSKKVIKR